MFWLNVKPALLDRTQTWFCKSDEESLAGEVIGYWWGSTATALDEWSCLKTAFYTFVLLSTEQCCEKLSWGSSLLQWPGAIAEI